MEYGKYVNFKFHKKSFISWRMNEYGKSTNQLSHEIPSLVCFSISYTFVLKGLQAYNSCISLLAISIVQMFFALYAFLKFWSLFRKL